MWKEIDSYNNNKHSLFGNRYWVIIIIIIIIIIGQLLWLFVRGADYESLDWQSKESKAEQFWTRLIRTVLSMTMLNDAW